MSGCIPARSSGPSPIGGRAVPARKAADRTTAGPVGDGAALTDRYEQLRAAVLAGTGDGLRLGLGVLTCRGLAAWMTAWQVTPPAPAPVAGRVPSARTAQATGTNPGDMVQILASMALAHL